jgi:hypothetical protein
MSSVGSKERRKEKEAELLFSATGFNKCLQNKKWLPGEDMEEWVSPAPEGPFVPTPLSEL